MTVYFERDFTPTILAALKEMPVVIIEAGNQCIALEIKSGTRWQDKDLSALKAFLKTTPHCKAAILGYNGTDSVRLGEKLWAIPLSLILS